MTPTKLQAACWIIVPLLFLWYLCEGFEDRDKSDRIRRQGP